MNESAKKFRSKYEVSPSQLEEATEEKFDPNVAAKEIEIEGEKFIISFKNKKAYSYYSGEEVAECTIETDSEEVIETILTDRIKLYLTELRNSSCIEDEDEFWD